MQVYSKKQTNKEIFIDRVIGGIKYEFHNWNYI